MNRKPTTQNIDLMVLEDTAEMHFIFESTRLGLRVAAQRGERMVSDWSLGLQLGSRDLSMLLCHSSIQASKLFSQFSLVTGQRGHANQSGGNSEMMRTELFAVVLSSLCGSIIADDQDFSLLYKILGAPKQTNKKQKQNKSNPRFILIYL